MLWEWRELFSQQDGHLGSLSPLLKYQSGELQAIGCQCRSQPTFRCDELFKAVPVVYLGVSGMIQRSFHRCSNSLAARVAGVFGQRCFSAVRPPGTCKALSFTLSPQIFSMDKADEQGINWFSMQIWTAWAKAYTSLHCGTSTTPSIAPVHGRERAQLGRTAIPPHPTSIS